MSGVTRHRFSVPVDKSRVETDWNARGYTCDWMMDSTGREWRDCRHQSNAVLAVVDGTLEVIVNGVKSVLQPGDEMTVPKGALHHLKNVDPTTSRWLYGFSTRDEVDPRPTAGARDAG